jgi:hypothetical protein
MSIAALADVHVRGTSPHFDDQSPPAPVAERKSDSPSQRQPVSGPLSGLAQRSRDTTTSSSSGVSQRLAALKKPAAYASSVAEGIASLTSIASSAVPTAFTQLAGTAGAAWTLGAGLGELANRNPRTNVGTLANGINAVAGAGLGARKPGLLSPPWAPGA